MNSTLHRVAVDCADTSAPATFSASMHDRPVAEGATSENSGTLFSDEAVSEESSALHRAPELKLVKNRLHHRAHSDS
ncbi:MAG: hypothetical protein QOD72_171 [Acidimicrobiaceae bacterium]|nr:hypothetical protein [Acidimicrobiaceae bacterium]